MSFFVHGDDELNKWQPFQPTIVEMGEGYFECLIRNHVGDMIYNWGYSWNDIVAILYHGDIIENIFGYA